MLTEERHLRITELVLGLGSVGVPRLANDLGVSEATIRRDLDLLSERGLVRRVRGGAWDPSRRVGRIRPEADSDGFETASTRQSAQKRQIATRAVSLVDDGDVIALDIGTTVFEMCDLLREREITVVTASLPVLRALEDSSSVDLIVLGGVLRPTYGSLVGALTESCLRQIRVDKAFMGASGVRPDGAVLDTTPSEVPVKRAMIEISTQAWLLADQQKFPGKGVMRVAAIDAFAGLITDQEPGGALVLEEDMTLEVLTP